MARNSAPDDIVARLAGTWKLMSCFMEDVQTKERIAAWGEHPNGYLVLTPGGRWLVIQTSETRPAAETEQDRAAAFQSMLAYSGRYRIEDDRLVIKVDIAWDESWNGTEQVRKYRIDDDKLHIEANPQRYANFGDRELRGILIWTRDDHSERVA